MTSRDFCYWLQGFFELCDSAKGYGQVALSVEQAECIKRHLAMVFRHEIDPSMGDKKHQKELTELHVGAEPITPADKPEDFSKCPYGTHLPMSDGSVWHICPNHLPLINC